MTYFEPSKGLFLRILLFSVIVGTIGTVIYLFVNPKSFFYEYRTNNVPYIICVTGGCSGELCLSEEDASGTVSNCMYKDSYACYQKATCEGQSNGSCGWTQTPELKACLSNPPALN